MYNKSTLSSGVTLVTENLPHSSSISLGLWICAGSRDETPAENGLAHLIEHLVFKGTPNRDTLAIATEIDSLGGLTNAFTEREHVAFHTRVRPEHLERAVDLLTDIFHNSLYTEKDLELEKQVIAQEIAMVQDEPEELISELALAAAWPKHSLAMPIAGTLESIEALDQKAIKSWLGRKAADSRLLISAVGAVEHQWLYDLLQSRWPVDRPTTAEISKVTRPQFCPGVEKLKRPLEQTHLLMSFDMPDQKSPDRWTASVFNLLLGGYMSSRLFQKIREEHGLAYNVYSHYSAYQEAGRLEIYAGTDPNKVSQVRALIEKELDDLAKVPLSQAELYQAIESLTTSFFLSQESLESRMTRLAKNESIHGRYISPLETAGKLAEVNSENVKQLATGLKEQALFLLGPKF